MEQFSSLIEFRQAVYDQGLTLAKDAQFELLDALLLSPYVRSFPELTLSPTFRRQWHSGYAAMEGGGQNREWLEGYFVKQIPRSGPQVFPLDDFDAEAEKFLTEKLASNSAVVLKLTKRAALEGAAHNYGEAIKSIEGIYLDELMKTKDANEGLTAFLEKREPVWKDE